MSENDYPQTPGYKDQGAGRAAALSLAPNLGHRQAEVLAALRALGDATPDEIAERIGRPPHVTRPRLSELYLLGLARKTGTRRPSSFGTPQTVYRPTTSEEHAIHLARESVQAEKSGVE